MRNAIAARKSQGVSRAVLFRVRFCNLR